MAQQNGALEQTATAEVEKEETAATPATATVAGTAKSNGESATEPASAEVQKEDTAAPLAEATEARTASSNDESAKERACGELSADLLTEIAVFEELAGSGEADKLRALMRAVDAFEANPSG